MKKIIYLTFLLFLNSLVSGQTTFRTFFGGSNPKFINQNQDGSYMAGFDSLDYISVLQLSPCGDVIYYKSYHMGNIESKLTSIVRLWNGYIISGTCSDSSNYCEYNAFYLATNFSGDSISSKKFDCNNEWGSYGGPVLATNDSNFIFRYFIDAAGISNYSRIIKTNTTDTIYWTAQGGNDWSLAVSSMMLDTAGFLFHIYTSNIQGESVTSKIDLSGQEIATLYVYDTTYTDYYNSHSITTSKDGGYLESGNVRNEMYVLKADSNLDSTWTKSYPYYSNEPVGLMHDSDSGYVMLLNNQNGGFDLFHVNNLGDSLDLTSYYDMNQLSAKCINKCLDGGFIIIAETTDSTTNLTTSLLLKTNSLGLVQNDTIEINAQICNGSNYILPDGSSVTNAGIFTTNYINNFGCNSITRTTLSINANPSVHFSTSQILCYGDSAQVSVSGLGGTSPYTGVGTFNLPAGNYLFIISDSNNCSDSSQVTIIEPSQLFANAGLPTGLCPGDMTSIGGSPTGSGGTGALNYQWSPILYLNSSTSPNPTANPQVTQTYQVLVTDSNGCNSISDVTVYVGSNVIPAILQTDDSLYTLSSGSFYEWYFNGILISSNNLPYLIATQSGDYQLTVFDSIGCEGVSGIFPVIVTSISSQSVSNNVLISPNPAENWINVQLSEPINDGMITLYDITGKAIQTIKIQGLKTFIDLSNIMSSVYILELKTLKATTFSRLIINK